MPEAQRLVSAVPRGLVRFTTADALAAKPVNDSIDLTLSCSLPPGFAYVLSALAFEIIVDTATDWDPLCRFFIFSGIPNIPVASRQSSAYDMKTVDGVVGADVNRILSFNEGNVRDWYPNPIFRTDSAAISAQLQYHNSAAAVGAAGLINFHLSFYQYEINQALRYPLNFPLPVGIR